MAREISVQLYNPPCWVLNNMIYFVGNKRVTKEIFNLYISTRKPNKCPPYPKKSKKRPYAYCKNCYELIGYADDPELANPENRDCGCEAVTKET